jgi:nicotinamidase-related amidase
MYTRITMAKRKRNLHGSAPDGSRAALLIIDMINDLEFEGGARLLPGAVAVAQRIAALKSRARARGIPAIYANDNFGRWRSDFREAVRHCLRDDVRGRPLVELLRPQEDDYFVIKPKHSAFYATTLATLLRYLGARRLLLTGISGDTCVMFTAMDGYLRDYQLYVPADCMTSISTRHNRAALDYMKRTLDADTRRSEALDLRAATRA